MSENINEEFQQIKTKGNRKYLTFIATEDISKLKIPNTCPTRSQTKVSRIQLEKGKEPSEYEAPKQERVGASGILKRLGALEINMSDENSDLWSRIKANNRAMMIGYFSEDVENKLAINSKQVINQIESKIDGRLTILRSSIDGIERRVRGVEGVKSEVTQLSDLVASKVSREDVQSLILQDEENIIQRVKSNLDGRELISSINLDKSGVRIKGELITLDGKSYISTGIIEDAHIKNGTITSAKIASLSASKITTGTLNANNVNIINLNASSMTAGVLSGVRSEYDLNHGIIKTWSNDRSRYSKITDGTITLESNRTAYRTTMIGSGITFHHNDKKVGYLEAVGDTKALSLSHQPGMFLAITGRDRGKDVPYIYFDAYGVINPSNKNYRVNIMQSTYFDERVFFEKEVVSISPIISKNKIEARNSIYITDNSDDNLLYAIKLLEGYETGFRGKVAFFGTVFNSGISVDSSGEVWIVNRGNRVKKLS